ncbi:MAG TPA: amidohydrolase family protein, partial [Sphingobium sp.]
EKMLRGEQMADFDLVIRGGTIADGLGGPLFDGDIGICGDKIAAVGQGLGVGIEEIDAKGHLVTPGFVDIHTHYDGQVIWDNRLTPSSFNGVTTVVMGNCGVGFAPVRPENREPILELMEGVEDIPGDVLRQGLSWKWETFEEYLEFIGSRAFDMDVAALVPHAPLRLYVMGDRAANFGQATEDDIAQMSALTSSAIKAGAVGFSTSRSTNHRSSTGQLTPTLKASEAELTGIAQAIADAGGGVLELSSSNDLDERARDFEMFRRIAGKTGLPLTFAIAQSNGAPDDWRATLRQVDDAQADGINIVPQFPLRPVGAILTIEGSSNPFQFSPTYKGIVATNDDAEIQVARLREPAVRSAVLNETIPHAEGTSIARFGGYERLFPQNGEINYEPNPMDSIGALARAEGRHPLETLYDCMHQGRTGPLIYFPTLNYANYNLDHVGEMLEHPYTVPGLGDGGAHVGIISDASFPTSLLMRWAKPLNPDGFDLGWIVKRHTADTARLFGLNDRGVIDPGMKADINVIDLPRLGLKAPIMVRDLPGGGKRLLQKTTGYVATIVSGKAVYRNGEATGALPGRLVKRAMTPAS